MNIEEKWAELSDDEKNEIIHEKIFIEKWGFTVPIEDGFSYVKPDYLNWGGFGMMLELLPIETHVIISNGITEICEGDYSITETRIAWDAIALYLLIKKGIKL